MKRKTAMIYTAMMAAASVLAGCSLSESQGTSCENGLGGVNVFTNVGFKEGKPVIDVHEDWAGCHDLPYCVSANIDESEFRYCSECKKYGEMKCDTEDGGAACVDVLESREHCGSCGQRCGAGEKCNMGVCECDSDYSNCGDTKSLICVNKDTNKDHCGSCGHRCGADEKCSMGVCVCDTESINACGSCDHFCKEWEVCSYDSGEGRCVGDTDGDGINDDVDECRYSTFDKVSHLRCTNFKDNELHVYHASTLNQLKELHTFSDSYGGLTIVLHRDINLADIGKIEKSEISSSEEIRVAPLTECDPDIMNLWNDPTMKSVFSIKGVSLDGEKEEYRKIVYEIHDKNGKLVRCPLGTPLLHLGNGADVSYLELDFDSTADAMLSSEWIYDAVGSKFNGKGKIDHVKYRGNLKTKFANLENYPSEKNSVGGLIAYAHGRLGGHGSGSHCEDRLSMTDVYADGMSIEAENASNIGGLVGYGQCVSLNYTDANEQFSIDKLSIVNSYSKDIEYDYNTQFYGYAGGLFGKVNFGDMTPLSVLHVNISDVYMNCDATCALGGIAGGSFAILTINNLDLKMGSVRDVSVGDSLGGILGYGAQNSSEYHTDLENISININSKSSSMSHFIGRYNGHSNAISNNVIVNRVHSEMTYSKSMSIIGGFENVIKLKLNDVSLFSDLESDVLWASLLSINNMDKNMNSVEMHRVVSSSNIANREGCIMNVQPSDYSSIYYYVKSPDEVMPWKDYIDSDENVTQMKSDRVEDYVKALSHDDVEWVLEEFEGQKWPRVKMSWEKEAGNAEVNAGE